MSRAIMFRLSHVSAFQNITPYLNTAHFNCQAVTSGVFLQETRKASWRFSYFAFTFFQNMFTYEKGCVMYGNFCRRPLVRRTCLNMFLLGLLTTAQHMWFCVLSCFIILSSTQLLWLYFRFLVSFCYFITLLLCYIIFNIL